MLVMICGGTKHVLTPQQTAWLDELRVCLPMTGLIPGGGRFLDAALTAWAPQHGLPVVPMPPDWQPGHAHGAMRRAQYLRLLAQHTPPGEVALVALPGGEGTKYLTTQARRLGLPVYVFQEETAMPEMTTPPTPDAPTSPVPMLEDDIPDVTAPDAFAKTLQDAPGTTTAPATISATPSAPEPAWRQHEALLQGFLAHLQQRFDAELVTHATNLMKSVDSMALSVKAWIEAFAGHNEHANYQLADALLKLRESGLQLRHDPYEANVQALSPQGYPVQIRVVKQTTGDLVEALPALMHWLAEAGYKPVV